MLPELHAFFGSKVGLPGLLRPEGRLIYARLLKVIVNLLIHTKDVSDLVLVDSAVDCVRKLLGLRLAPKHWYKAKVGVADG